MHDIIKWKKIDIDPAQLTVPNILHTLNSTQTITFSFKTEDDSIHYLYNSITYRQNPEFFLTQLNAAREIKFWEKETNK